MQVRNVTLASLVFSFSDTLSSTLSLSWYVCRRFELRFTIVQDRYDSSKFTVSCL